MDDSTPETKVCRVCGQEKPLAEFHKHPSSAGGHIKKCMECTKRQNKERRLRDLDLARQKDKDRYARDKPRINQRNNSYYAANPEPAKRRAKKWRTENPDRMRKHRNAYVTRNIVKERARLRGYDRRYPERKRAHVMRRLSKRRHIPVLWSAQIWQECLDHWQHKCCVCGRSEGLWHLLAQEHWIAIADPRPDNPGTVPWNMLPMCHSKQGANGMGSCNSSKGSKDPIEWLLSKYDPQKANQILKRIESYFALMKEKHFP